MAIINCAECGKEISDQAKVCPNCGRPVKKPGKGLAIASLVLGIIACVYSFSVFTNATNELLPLEGVMAFAVFVGTMGILAVVFAGVARSKGCRLKKCTAGLTLGIISLSLLLISIFAAAMVAL